MYRQNTSQQAEKLARFEQQMADYVRGQRLVSLRQDKRLSQRDAAYEIGVTEKSLRSWEKGGTIRWHNAQKVAAFYGVDPEELVAREALNDDHDTGPVTQMDRIEAAVNETLTRMDVLELQLALLVPALTTENKPPAKGSKSRKTATKRAAG